MNYIQIIGMIIFFGAVLGSILIVAHKIVSECPICGREWISDEQGRYCSFCNYPRRWVDTLQTSLKSSRSETDV